MPQPSIYGPQHIIYLSIVSILMFFFIVLIKKFITTDKKLTILIKTIGFLLLLTIFWNRISISVGRDNLKLLWPDSYCGTSSFVLAIATILFKKDNRILHFVTYLGFVGGMVTLIYPDFIDQSDSIFYSMTISGLLHHTLMVFLVLVIFITGYIKPTIKKWSIMPIGLTIYMTYGLFLITIIGLDDAMYIYEPVLSGTILNWFYLGLIFVPVYTVFLFIWDRHLNKRI